ncbi:MAG: hypothetical protein ACRDPT_09495, partial [Streptomycetales bacterium]
MVTGAVLCGAAVMLAAFAGSALGRFEELLAQPAAWSVPVAFAVMVVVSLLTRSRVAPHVARTMVRMHIPETVRLDRGQTVRRGRSTARRPHAARDAPLAESHRPRRPRA